MKEFDAHYEVDTLTEYQGSNEVDIQKLTNVT
jgi:hypothetical protein